MSRGFFDRAHRRARDRYPSGPEGDGMTGRHDPGKVLLWVLLGVVAVAVLIGSAGVGMGHFALLGGGIMGLMALWMFLPVLLVVLLVWLLVDRSRPASDQVEPLLIAERRYAAGEISREEFERIRDDLGRYRGHA